MAKSNPARATKLDQKVPLKAAQSREGAKQARAQLKTIGNQKDRGKDELFKLREEIKSEANSTTGKSGAARASQDKVKLALAQIKRRFGDPEFAKAVREFNLTFKGIQDINLNTLGEGGKGSV
jgi:DNA anti-recombination protein RmuC